MEESPQSTDDGPRRKDHRPQSTVHGRNFIIESVPFKGRLLHPMAFKFENLKIWQLSLELTDQIDLLAQTFPVYELYSLSSQMRRAANSVSLNIVEGSTGLSNTEFRRFLLMANRSALEVVGCLFLAKRRKYLSEEKFVDLYKQSENLVKKIQALINTLKD